MARIAGLTAAMVLCMSGCASVPSSTPIETALGLPTQVELTHVAFYPQTQDLCGPAALATVLDSAGVKRTLQQLEADVYLPQREGSLPLEMLGGARQAGVLPYLLKPNPHDLWREVSAGHPVVILQNLRWNWLPLWHYAVVVGYDNTAKTVILRSGDTKRLVMPMADFESSWSKSQYWAFVALPPDQLPATATASEFVQAAIALERVAPLQAAQAYQTALQAWPDQLQARLALGNSHYKRGEWQAAEKHYAQATVDHPDAADAWNNWAQVLWDMNQPTLAQAAIAKALTLGGPRLERYRSTQAAIEQTNNR